MAKDDFLLSEAPTAEIEKLRELYRLCSDATVSVAQASAAGRVDTEQFGSSLDRDRPDAVMTVYAPSLPKYNRSSSGLRILQLLKAAAPFFSEIRFVYFSRTEFDPVYIKALPEKVVAQHVARSSETLLDIVEASGSRVLLITDLFDLGYIRDCSRLIDLMRVRVPDCKVTLDTMDCHWKKYARKAAVSDDIVDWKLAWQYLQLEEDIYPKSDLVTVVTSDEGNAIEKSIPGTPPFEVIPNCYALGERLPRFETTRNLCFVGSAGVNHNLDAMRYFRDMILPELARAYGECKVFVIGSGWLSYESEFNGASFVFRGHVAELDRELTRYRLFICPLTYGAGLKGKLGSAASAGLPVVTTSVGFEGYPQSGNHGCFIADDPYEFANACIRLLNEKPLWEHSRDSFRRMVELHYGMSAMQHAIGKFLARIRRKESISAA